MLDYFNKMKSFADKLGVIRRHVDDQQDKMKDSHVYQANYTNSSRGICRRGGKTNNSSCKYFLCVRWGLATLGRRVSNVNYLHQVMDISRNTLGDKASY